MPVGLNAVRNAKHIHMTQDNGEKKLITGAQEVENQPTMQTKSGLIFLSDSLVK